MQKDYSEVPPVISEHKHTFPEKIERLRHTPFEAYGVILADYFFFGEKISWLRIWFEDEGKKVSFFWKKNTSTFSLGKQKLDFEEKALTSGGVLISELSEAATSNPELYALMAANESPRVNILPFTQNNKACVISFGYGEPLPAIALERDLLDKLAVEIMAKMHEFAIEKELEERQKEVELLKAEQEALKGHINAIHQNLEDTIQERTTELNRKADELRTVFYRSSHDFRSPLATLKGLIQLLGMQLPDEVESQNLLLRCKESLESMDRMLGKLKLLSEIVETRDHWKTISIPELIADIRKHFRPSLEVYDIQFLTNFSPDAVSVLTEPASLRVVLESFIENSLTFFDRQKQNRYVKIEVEIQDERVCFHISDNGVGIPPEFHSQIFQMYFRGSEFSQGQGLGLYVADKVTSALGGKITFRSIPGQETVFTLWL